MNLLKLCGNRKYVAQNKSKQKQAKMALEKRGGNYYYYKKERIGNRVFSKYYGKGELASLIRQMDEIDREQKHLAILEKLRFREKIEGIDREIDLYESKVEEITAETLLSLGFYKTKSREWRFKVK